MSTTPTQDILTGVATQSSVQGTSASPFAGATISSSNDSTDYVTCYVLNDNAAAGTLDTSQLPAGCSNAPGGGTLVMISGTVATVQQALRAMLFKPAALAVGTTLTAHLTIVMSNADGDYQSTRSMTTAAVSSIGTNVALLGVPAAATVADTQATVFMPHIAVVSAGSDGVQVRVSMSDPSLGAFDTSAAAALGVTVTSNQDGSVTLGGTAASVTAGLDALGFVPEAQVAGTTGKEIFSLAATDMVNGTTGTASATVAVTGSLPAVTLAGVAGSASLSGGASVALFTALTVQERVSGNLTATVATASPGSGQFDISQLPVGVAGGVTATLSQDGSGVTLVGAAASVQADLRALQFVAANPSSGTSMASVSVTLAADTGATASATEQLSIASSGSAPVLSGNAPVSMAGNTALLYPGIALAGPTTTVSATIALSDTSVAAFDQAAFSQAEAGNNAISFAFDTAGSHLRITGATADVASALHAVALQAATPATGVQSTDVATLTLQADAGVSSYATDILVDGPALVADSVSGVASTATVIQGIAATPFAQSDIVDGNNGDALVAVVTCSAAGYFDAASLGAGAVLSGNGSAVTLSGSAIVVQAALRALAVRAPASGTPGQVTLTLQLSNRAGDASLSSAAITQTLTVKAPAYSADTGSETSGHVFAVSSDASQTASIDLSGNPNTDIVVFGGDAALSLKAAHTTVVLNGANQNGAVTLDSLGDDAVWVGAAPVDCTAGGHIRFVLGNEAQTSSTVTVHGGTASDSNEFDVWGDGSEQQTIRTDGVAASTVFGGASRLDFTGGNAVVVLDGATQTGAATVHSLGGNTVWAGTAALDLFEGAGNDTIVLTGSAPTTIHGATTPQGGTTTVLSLGNAGTFTYDGGAKAAVLNLSGGSNLVHAGSAAETVTMSGGGSLLVEDDTAATGAQHITMAAGGSASLKFLGGGNPATLVLGGGAATIDAGSHTSITGGSGSASIDLSDAVGAVLAFDGSMAGNVDVLGFDPSRASVQLTHVVSSAVQNGSLVVGFADGAHATFQDYTDPTHAGIGFG